MIALDHTQQQDNSRHTLKVHLETFVATMRRIVREDLVGIYLHGSVALGSFNPDRSDINLLVVTRQRLPIEAKHDIAEYLLSHSGHPYPYAVTFMTESHLLPWRHPAPCDFRYTENRRMGFELALAGQTWRNWNNARLGDHDIAVHIAHVMANGRLLYGREPEYTFPNIPDTNIVDSLVRMARQARDLMMKDPVEAVLSTCRVYHYLAEGKLTSKLESGLWTMASLSRRHHAVLQPALNVYTGKTHLLPFDPIDLAQFVAYLDAKISQELMYRGYR